VRVKLLLSCDKVQVDGKMSDAKDYEINKHHHPVERQEIGSKASRDVLGSMAEALFNMVDKPVTWFRGE